VLPGLGVYLLFSCSAFVATVHDEAHDAFMTPPAYTMRGREGEVPSLSPGPTTSSAECWREDMPSFASQRKNKRKS
jgi:hypothetical protein